MKKKEPDSKSELIRDVVVHRENLEEIIQLFESRGMHFTISDSGFEYSELDEVTKKRGYHLRELDISGNVSGDNYGSIFVSFSKDRTQVLLTLVPQELCGMNLWIY